jgi:hypothetical protein
MSDPDPNDPRTPAANRPTRSVEASRRLSQLLSRPLGTPAPPGETVEPVLPRVARPAPVPEAAPAPPDDTASAPPAPAAAADPEPNLPWFDRPGEPRVASEPVAAPEPPPALSAKVFPDMPPQPEAGEPRPDQPAEHEADLFDRPDPPRHTPVDLDDVHRSGPLAYQVDLGTTPAADKVPEWAWPSKLDRAPEAAATARSEVHAAPEPLATSEPARPARTQAPPPAGRPLDPDATRALGNIRRLMLVSNLFMVVAIGAVLVVVGYRLFRSEPAPPPPPPPTPKPALAAIPNDMTLSLPRGARIVQTAVAGERVVITLEIDGATEIRTFDVKTLQPTGRMSFTIVP